jgi:hypothetical protein
VGPFLSTFSVNRSSTLRWDINASFQAMVTTPRVGALRSHSVQTRLAHEVPPRLVAPGRRVGGLSSAGHSDAGRFGCGGIPRGGVCPGAAQRIVHWGVQCHREVRMQGRARPLLRGRPDEGRGGSAHRAGVVPDDGRVHRHVRLVRNGELACGRRRAVR